MTEKPEELVKLTGSNPVMQLEIAVLTQIRDNISLVNATMKDHGSKIEELTKSVVRLEEKPFAKEIDRLTRCYNELEHKVELLAAKADLALIEARTRTLELDGANLKGKLIPISILATAILGAVLSVLGNSVLRMTGN